MRVVLAEDQVLLRDGIARALEASGIRVVAQVGDASALLAAVSSQHPDVAVVDVRMPPGFADEGAQAALAIRARYPDTAVLVLSSAVDPQLAATLAATGARAFGYLLKDRVLDVSSFIDAVRTVADGGTVIDDHVITVLLGEGQGRLGILSGRELQVVALLAAGRSNAAIGRELSISERTVDAHLRSLFVKLGLEQDPDINRRVRAAIAWLDAAAAPGA